jgi:type II secretory pathway pseudopilin PulG
MKHTSGFTLLEVVVSVGVALALMGAIIVNYNGYNDRQTLKQVALTLKNNFRFLQTKALSGEKPTANCTELSGWTISFTSGTYTMRATCTPEGAQGTSTTVTLPTGVQFNPVPSSFTFRVLSRGTTLTAATDITLAGFNETYILQVSPGGDVSDEGLQ